MGRKVNPNGIRVGIVSTWPSVWYASKKDYAKQLHEDLRIREYIKKDLKAAGVAEVRIERQSKKAIITIHAARPGVVIGRKGGDIDKIKKHVEAIVECDTTINIVEVKKPELSAVLVANSVAKQLENRVSFRRAVKKSIQSSMRMGAKGIKISVSGRLGGAEIARTEWYREGRVPLHTLRAKIELAKSEAHTTYGVIGVKVWIYLGDALEKKQEKLTK